MAQLGKSMLQNPKKDADKSNPRNTKSNPRNTKSNPRVSREAKRNLWFTSLVTALLLAFVLLAFDFSSIYVHQWKIGQIAASDVYSPARLTVNSEEGVSNFLPGEVVVRRGQKVTGAICVALNVISAQSRFSALPRTIGFLFLLLVVGHIINKFFKVRDIKWLENKRSLNLFLVTVILSIAESCSCCSYSAGTSSWL